MKDFELLKELAETLKNKEIIITHFLKFKKPAPGVYRYGDYLIKREGHIKACTYSAFYKDMYIITYKRLEDAKGFFEVFEKRKQKSKKEPLF